METWDPSRVLYKYLDAEGAFQTLSKRSVKCSSPLTFNDPFDTVTEIQLDFEPEAFPDAFMNALKELIFSDKEPVFEAETDFSLFIRVARRNRDSIDKNASLDPIRPQIAAQLDVVRATTEKGNQDWQRFLETWRIYCLSEVNDNLLMWAHYADKHRGAVIGFRCVPAVDSCFCAATKVNYKDHLPSLGSLDEWIQHLIGEKRIDLESRFMEMTYTKSVDWQYEHEYRYALPALLGRSEPFDIRTVLPEEIHSLWLGCRISDTDRQRLSTLLRGDLEHVELHQARKAKNRFAVEFEKLR